MLVREVSGGNLNLAHKNVGVVKDATTVHPQPARSSFRHETAWPHVYHLDDKRSGRGWRPFRIYNLSVTGLSNERQAIFLCGKMAAGKSTLAKRLAERESAILLSQDELLERLYPGEILDIPDFLKCSSRVQQALTPHICALLSKGVPVVLDFPANTTRQRAWFRELIDRTQVEHELHFVDASDTLCKLQLKDRSKHLPPGTPWTTEAEFDAITSYFQPPTEAEAFHVVLHQRT